MEASAEPIIRVEGLRASYGGRVILEHVSFEVARGEVLVILGTSGCGKSTLLKHMIGLYEADEGRVVIDGDDIVRSSSAERRGLLRRIGVMYQSGALFGSMTLLENVRLPLEVFTDLSREAMDAIAASKLRLVGLGAARDRLPSELSGGMRKRAAIARAMALDPMVLFLDEPSAGLDPVTSAEVDALVLSLAEALEVTFVIVTHELRSIFRIADRAVMLDRESRGIIAVGRPSDLRDSASDPRVRRFFRPDEVVAGAASSNGPGRPERSSS